MARKPNYGFERQERDRQKALKLAEKAAAKQRQREASTDQPPTGGPLDEEPGAD